MPVYLRSDYEHIVVFTLDELSFALPLFSVLKVLHAIEITYLPKAPAVITGVINVKGVITPVADIRKLVGLRKKEISLNDRLIIAYTGKREVAILVDSVSGIRDIKPGQVSFNEEKVPLTEHLSGITKGEDDLILIYDLSAFLNIDEEKELGIALTERNNGS
jgi:purine-binding chemotaxis protein CheW